MAERPDGRQPIIGYNIRMISIDPTTTIQADTTTIQIGGVTFPASRPHAFGLVIDQPLDCANSADAQDYLHRILLSPGNREPWFELVEAERLVVCRNVHSDAPSYRRVRGKSSASKLSQAEYYHHDGCSSPVKPFIVEIRCPHQAVARNIATAIAPFPAVIRAMVSAIPSELIVDQELLDLQAIFAGPKADYPPPSSWDAIQGKITRLVRRELDAERCRDYFRCVDSAANAYVLAWEMGESRWMLNSHSDLTRTMQHRRSYQRPRGVAEQNGSLVKRWPAEELSDACGACGD